MKKNENQKNNKENRPFDITGVILAGGKSSRMGQDKSLLPLAETGHTMIENIWLGLKPLCKEILISGNSNGKYNLPGAVEISDIYPGRGPLSGIHAGLKKAAFDYALIVSCDLAAFNRELAVYLLSNRHGHELVMPGYGGLFEPLFAVYHKNTLNVIEKHLLAGDNRVSNIISEVDLLTVKEDEIRNFAEPQEVFRNINTPEDYRRLNSKLKRGRNE